jgi:hypothetical protein
MTDEGLATATDLISVWKGIEADSNTECNPSGLHGRDRMGDTGEVARGEAKCFSLECDCLRVTGGGDDLHISSKGFEATAVATGSIMVILEGRIRMTC